MAFVHILDNRHLHEISILLRGNLVSWFWTSHSYLLACGWYKDIVHGKMELQSIWNNVTNLNQAFENITVLCLSKDRDPKAELHYDQNPPTNFDLHSTFICKSYQIKIKKNPIFKSIGEISIPKYFYALDHSSSNEIFSNQKLKF